ncbi:hypothetical protein BD410DRAFT_844727 [Rickenella mellea]|uniref:Zn(2)-C6 fungal-type domain-containing protein n=1 Tax=Rickenella mellea TaxID=50990 RepID=A0A4Y7PMC8_9AGAM|nr:hypothetical protein BD410DRAFT_844727 [Rickenella mellea]
MLPLSLTVSNAPQYPATDTTSSRNKDRNRRPCGNCSGSKVRCIVSHPYSKILCKRCKEDGLTECPPYVQWNPGKRRHAPRRKRDHAPPVEPSDASDIVFISEKIFTTNNTEDLHAGGGEIWNASAGTSNVYTQTSNPPSATQIKYLVGHGETVVPGEHQANNIISASSNMPSTSAAAANGFDRSTTNASISNEAVPENSQPAYNWFGFLNGPVN